MPSFGTKESNKMSNAITLHFESKLHAPAERVWEWIISVKGIRAEMWPFFLMTAPKGVQSLDDVQIAPGKRMFRSYVFLFGFLPIDYSDMTLLELKSGQGFIEQSPMGSMKLWRHERKIVPCSSDASAILLVDRLTFQPRMAKRLVDWFIRRVFIHRHEVLKANLGGAQPGTPADVSAAASRRQSRG
jgi:ligand-binding SRPBCC domain-containing protein